MTEQEEKDEADFATSVIRRLKQRERFARAAMTALVTSGAMDRFTPQVIAEKSYEIADCMIDHAKLIRADYFDDVDPALRPVPALRPGFDRWPDGEATG